jgi:hypothetical protein
LKRGVHLVAHHAWGPIGERGRVVLWLGGLRACEGVRGRVRACFTLIRQECSFRIEFNSMSLTFVKQVYNGTIFSSYHFSDPYLRVISRQILVLVPQNQSKYFNTALNILPLKAQIK